MGLTRTDLQTIATRTGSKVVAAWSSHDQGAMGTVQGVVMHHTGSSQASSAVAPTLAIVRDGRSDLQNALSAFYIDKAGTIYLITEKVAWHAGAGAWNGITDANGHCLGIEAESDGVTWTTATVDSYVALVAEILRFLGRDVSWAIRHADWALPKGRKTDFAGLNEADFKARVTARLITPTEDDLLADERAMLTRIFFELTNPFPSRVPGSTVKDTLVGTALNTDATGWATSQRLAKVEAKIDALATAKPAAAAVTVDAAAVATSLASNAGFLAALAKAVNDDAASRLKA